MGPVWCEKCEGLIERDDLDRAADTAYCRQCGHRFRPSETRGPLYEPVDGIDPDAPPDGCDVRTASDGGRTLRASTFRLGGAVIGIGVALFWNGILSPFIALNFMATLYYLGVPMPGWFADGLEMGPLLCALLWLFLLPFMLVGAATIVVALVNVMGHTEVSVRPGEGCVTLGLGRFGWRRRFVPERVTGVRLGAASWKRNDQTVPAIELDLPGDLIRLGSLLTEERRDWLLAAIKLALDGVRYGTLDSKGSVGPFDGQAGWS